jgi:hypothetical protein
LYGFRRITKGEDQGSYFHPKFQRDRKDLISEIRRLPGKGSLPTMEQFISQNQLPFERFGGATKKNYEKQANKKQPAVIKNTTMNLKNSTQQSSFELNQNFEAPSLSMSKLTRNIGYGKKIGESSRSNGWNKESVSFEKFDATKFNIPLNSNFGMENTTVEQQDKNVVPYYQTMQSTEQIDTVTYDMPLPKSLSNNNLLLPRISSSNSLNSLASNKYCFNDSEKNEFLELFNIPNLDYNFFDYISTQNCN